MDSGRQFSTPRVTFFGTDPFFLVWIICMILLRKETVPWWERESRRFQSCWKRIGRNQGETKKDQSLHQRTTVRTPRSPSLITRRGRGGPCNHPSLGDGRGGMFHVRIHVDVTLIDTSPWLIVVSDPDSFYWCEWIGNMLFHSNSILRSCHILMIRNFDMMIFFFFLTGHESNFFKRSDDFAKSHVLLSIDMSSTVATWKNFEKWTPPPILRISRVRSVSFSPCLVWNASDLYVIIFASNLLIQICLLCDNSLMNVFFFFWTWSSNVPWIHVNLNFQIVFAFSFSLSSDDLFSLTSGAFHVTLITRDWRWMKWGHRIRGKDVFKVERWKIRRVGRYLILMLYPVVSSWRHAWTISSFASRLWKKQKKTNPRTCWSSVVTSGDDASVFIRLRGREITSFDEYK